ncbi:MAG: hypothetical protein IJL08_07375 [Oscillospiraceae bacterium]|nr:hypothetical protein [Oscillospiraceae bacterium]
MAVSSQVLSYYSFEQVDITRFRIRPEINRQKVEAEFSRAVYPYITWTDGTELYAGDYAVLIIRSDNPKLCRSGLKVTIGAGLLGAEFEKALSGKKVGDSFSVLWKGETVFVTVESVKNRHKPELSDDMIAALNIPDVKTVAAYQTHLEKKELDEFFFEHSRDAVGYVLKQVQANSSILVTEADWNQTVEWSVNRLAALAAMDGMELRTMTPEDFRGRIPVKSYDELVVLMQREAWESVRMSLLGEYLAKQNGDTINADGYETFLTEAAAPWGRTAEEYRKAYPEAYYLQNEYCDYFRRAVTAYVRKNYFKEEKNEH